MERGILIVAVLILMSGCTKHTGTIEIFDGKCIATLGRPMLLEMTQDGTTVKADSRGDNAIAKIVGGLIEFAGQIFTLSFLKD